MMVSLSEKDYKNIARKTLAEIGRENFFNGTVPYETDEFISILKITLIVYRETLLVTDTCGNPTDRIVRIVPVWWEFQTWFDNALVSNDFSWSELTEFLE